jgi:uncharacterized protein YjeT (DUF2065 family)
MSNTLLTAIALMLVIEGVLPFLVPGLWRETFRRLIEMSDGQIRFIGLTSMLAGVILLTPPSYHTPDDASLNTGPPGPWKYSCSSSSWSNGSIPSCARACFAAETSSTTTSCHVASLHCAWVRASVAGT